MDYSEPLRMNVPAAIPMVHGPGCKKANVVATCRCGANAHCLTCGYGRGQAPCTCSPKLPSYQVYNARST